MRSTEPVLSSSSTYTRTHSAALDGPAPRSQQPRLRSKASRVPGGERLLAVNHCPPGFGPLTGPRPGRSPRSSIFERRTTLASMGWLLETRQKMSAMNWAMLSTQTLSFLQISSSETEGLVSVLRLAVGTKSHHACWSRTRFLSIGCLTRYSRVYSEVLGLAQSFSLDTTRKRIEAATREHMWEGFGRMRPRFVRSECFAAAMASVRLVLL